MATPTTLVFSPRRQNRLNGMADSVGAICAALCAMHCAVLPLLLALLPTLGAGVLGRPALEFGYVALAFLTPGLVAAWAGVLVPVLHDDVVLHAATMTLGGTLIAVAHLVNLRLGQCHVHNAICGRAGSLDPYSNYGIETP